MQGELPFGRHEEVVVDVEVVLVDVEVVGVVVEVLVEVLVDVLVVLLVVVVVLCSWHLPPEQVSVPQHCSSLVQCLPLRLHPGGSP